MSFYEMHAQVLTDRLTAAQNLKIRFYDELAATIQIITLQTHIMVANPRDPEFNTRAMSLAKAEVNRARLVQRIIEVDKQIDNHEATLHSMTVAASQAKG